MFENEVVRYKEADALVDFTGFIQREGIPMYLQISRYIKARIADGTIGDGEELPSCRMQSVYLTASPGTIQKAYRLLRDEGLVLSRNGARSYVRATSQQRSTLRREMAEQYQPVIRDIKRTGLSVTETITLLEKLYDEDN